MIVIPNRKAVIITPPKCGSTSAHELFYPYGYRVDGPQFERPNDIGKHTDQLTYGNRNYRIFVLIRNPADRFRSLYNHYIREQPFVLPENYVKWYVNFYPFYSWTIKQIVSQHPIIDWIRLEHITEDTWHKLGLHIEPLILNRNQENLEYLDIDCPEEFLKNDLPFFAENPYEHLRSNPETNIDSEIESG